MKVEILGVRIDNLTMEEALQKVDGFLKDGHQHYIVTPNPVFLVKAQKDKEFKEILNLADLAVPDGIGLVFASWFLGQPLKERITGIDLMEKICQKAMQKKWPVFLLGGQPHVTEKAVDNLRKKYLGLEVKRMRIGQRLEQPAVLFVALGASKQEKWINDNLRKMPSVRLAIGVGGSFDFISGRVQRAPKFLQTIGLEWLWRFFCQPWRIERIFKSVIVFPWMVIKGRISKDGPQM